MTRKFRRAIIFTARKAAAHGDHALARLLFAQVGIEYLQPTIRLVSVSIPELN